MNVIMLPTPPLPNHPCSNTNVPTGLLVFFIMQVYGILQVFIPEKQVLAKISIEPIKEASCLTEMWTGLYPVLTRLRLTVTGSSSVRMIPKSIISAGEYRPGTEKKKKKVLSSSTQTWSPDWRFWQLPYMYVKYLFPKIVKTIGERL